MITVSNKISKKLYVVQIEDTEYIIITNIPCSICFSKQNNCKLSYFVQIDEQKIEKWRKIAKTTIEGICECKL
jgi:hypothetical protein